MKKYQDEFSSSSYEELLKKYGGENTTGRGAGNQAQRPSAQQSTGRPAGTNNAQRPVAPRTNNISSNKNQDMGHTRSFNIDSLKNFEEPVNRTTRTANKQNAPQKKGKFVVNFDQAKNFASGITNKAKPSASNKQSGSTGKKANKVLADVGNAAKNATGFAVRTVTAHKERFITITCCLVISIIISSCILSCLNDVLAINRKGETTIEVTLPENADTYEAIRILDDAGLIKNSLFCNVFAKLMGFTDDNYLPGIYYFTDDMGIEKMLTRFKTSGTRGNLISITIPEGYTVDQIFQRLDKNKVCSADSLYRVMETVDFGNEYEFIAQLEDTDDRYSVLEGYMFPATYEFEQGSEPAAVIRKFLDKFKSVWDEEHAARATELGMTVDEVITLASIIEKEGVDKQQFLQISSVLHNRLDNSGVYPTLECDSTKDYVKNTIAKRASSPALKKFIVSYSTYDSAGLPPSAISNPGAEAIDAALNPADTQYYFFRHDNKGGIYLAKTPEDHNANGRIVDRVNAEG